jgi:arylsulfatase A-like enzyme
VASNISAPDTHYNWKRIDNGKEAATTTYSTTAVVNAAVGWWGATSGPKFAVLAAMAPHEPFDAPPANKLPAGYVVGSTQRAKFEAALVSLDFHLGALLGVIDFSNTHVVLVCDNGTAHQVPPPNGQSQGYKLTVYEGGVRVPLLWWGPGVLPGQDTTLVQSVDLARTILEVCGVLSPVAFADSISFESTLDGTPAGAQRRQYCYVSRFTPNNGTAPALTIDNFAVIREDGWKLLQEGSVYRLFHVTSDPWEQGGFDPVAPGFGSVTADLLGFRNAVLGSAWPY